MKNEIFNQEFNKMFKWFTNDSAPGLLKLELDIYKNFGIFCSWGILIILLSTIIPCLLNL